jgi:hypothetical protein
MDGEGQCAIMDAIGRTLTLRAASASLHWGKDSEAIKENAAAQAAIPPAFAKPHSYDFELQGFYRGMEDFCGLWVVGAVDRLPFLWAAVDYIAREAAEQHSPPMFVSNSFGFAHRFGADATAALLAVLRGSVPHLCQQWRRAETHNESDQQITAPVGTDDRRFDEAYLVECEQHDEHATLITFMDLDEDAFGSLSELVEQKWDAAKRAFLAPPSEATP